MQGICAIKWKYLCNIIDILSKTKLHLQGMNDKIQSYKKHTSMLFYHKIITEGCKMYGSTDANCAFLWIWVQFFKLGGFHIKNFIIFHVFMPTFVTLCKFFWWNLPKKEMDIYVNLFRVKNDKSPMWTLKNGFNIKMHLILYGYIKMDLIL